MKKILVFIVKYTVLIGCSYLLIIGHSPYLSRKYYMFFINAYGDLYHKSCLPEFQILHYPCSDIHKNTNKEGGTNIFFLGDSFFAGMWQSTSELKNVENVYYIHWLDQFIIPKQSKHSRNILFMESTERNLIFNYDTLNIVIDSAAKESRVVDFWKKNATAKIVTIESNDLTLTQLLFFDKTSLYFKNIKANLNRKFFNRIDENVRLSVDGKNLFYHEETDGFISSFIPLRTGEVDSVVAYYNAQYRHYKSLGFDEIYFTVIPNKVSLLAPNFQNKQYNHFAERIQYHPKLEVPFIDMYHQLNKAKDSIEIYHPDDTHWNCNGKRVFLDYVNLHFLTDSTARP